VWVRIPPGLPYNNSGEKVASIIESTCNTCDKVDRREFMHYNGDLPPGWVRGTVTNSIYCTTNCRKAGEIAEVKEVARTVAVSRYNKRDVDDLDQYIKGFEDGLRYARYRGLTFEGHEAEDMLLHERRV
jgi:hypothetical protein